jgi:glycosyltransferase involved in cell wall biosynthesis
MHGVVGKLDEAISIYYCVDECSEFPGVDRDSMKRMEIELLKKVNLGFATSPQILKRPVIGYFGAIERWMDLDLIHYLVQKKKEWTFLFIGKPIVDLSRFDNEPNIHFIGQRPFQELPRYGKIFDVAIIPFVINKLTEHVFPVKLKEYLSMGKPVVSSALPTVEGFCKENPDIVHIGYNPDDFMNKIETAIPTNTAFHISARQDSIKKDVWESRVKEISDIIEKHLAL